MKVEKCPFRIVRYITDRESLLGKGTEQTQKFLYKRGFTENEPACGFIAHTSKVFLTSIVFMIASLYQWL